MIETRAKELTRIVAEIGKYMVAISLGSICCYFCCSEIVPGVIMLEEVGQIYILRYQEKYHIIINNHSFRWVLSLLLLVAVKSQYMVRSCVTYRIKQLLHL